MNWMNPISMKKELLKTFFGGYSGEEIILLNMAFKVFIIPLEYFLLHFKLSSRVHPSTPIRCSCSSWQS